MEFKVGDEVRIINSHPVDGSSGVYDGDITTVVKIMGLTSSIIGVKTTRDHWSGSHWWLPDDCIEHLRGPW